MAWDRVAPPDAAPQHKRAPRPLPLFLHHVAQAAERNPQLAARALAGLRRYGEAPAPSERPSRPILHRLGGASLRDCGGDGPPVLLVPSLINPPNILDLDEETTLAGALADRGLRALLLDWGPAGDRATLDISGHVSGILLPLIEAIDDPPELVGYCLGGTMALAAANCAKVRKVATLAAPWRFAAYPESARAALTALFERAAPAAQAIGLMPMEVLQSAFWSLDPERVVTKFAAFADLPPDSRAAERFVLLESWANAGEPLPFPAAEQLVRGFFGADLPGSGHWQVGGAAVCPPAGPVLHVTATDDRIVPAASAAPGEQFACPSGHVGMIVGHRARDQLHAPLAAWLTD